jgi:cytochrome c peroxidase
MKRLVILLFATTLAIAAIGMWWQGQRDYQWQIDPNVPLPDVPIDNPMSDIKVELGRRLFYDNRLSVNNTMSCASCHIQALAFTDAKARAVGATGAVHPRSSMTLVNVAYASRLTWANQLLSHLEDQALTPLFGDNPVEMGMSGHEDDLVAMLKADGHYAELLPKAFPADEDPFSVVNVVRSISTFVRTIVSFDTPYDRYLEGDEGALSAQALLGMELFFSERLECFHCHGGFNFTDSTTHANANVDRIGYHNTGLYNIDDAGAYPSDNTGLYDMTGQRRDMGRFKAPTLRNIAVTAPYMHDGSVLTLDDALSHYARGGRLLEEGANAGDGRRNPFKSEFIRGFELSDDERQALLAFLDALTDKTVLTDPRFSNPH